MLLDLDRLRPRRSEKEVVVDNLKRFGTGALRRPSQDMPFPDLVESQPTRPPERLLAKHPSLKPQALMRFLVRASLPLAKGVVLDPFMGAGSTIAAAVHLGLNSVGVELDRKYFSMAKSAIPKLAEFEVMDQPQRLSNIVRGALVSGMTY